MRNKIIQGSCLDILPTLEPNSIDTIITDPPYGLSFMGKGWDHGVPGQPFWAEVLRVAKPGAMLLAFGGTRTWHRLACAIEDAGWEIRDTVLWLYGSGFPKSHDISKATKSQTWHGWGSALKPAFEPILLAMKPLDGTFANNALTWGVAGLNIDGGRVGTDEETRRNSKGGNNGLNGSDTFRIRARTVEEKKQPSGRWPANVLHDGSAEVLAEFDKAGVGRSAYANIETAKQNYGNPAKPGMFHHTNYAGMSYADSGSAARFFYCAKASKSERTHNGTVENKHPTVKPLALMRYLVKLTATPTGGTVLDPFAGSGSTGVACKLEGRDFIGIELETESAETAQQRIDATEPEPQQLDLI